MSKTNSINMVFLLLVLCFSLLLSGCIKLSTVHKQQADGSAVITETVDMNDLFVMAASYGSSYSTSQYGDAYFKELCQNASNENPGLKCSYSLPGTLILEKTYKKEDAYYKFETQDNLFSKKYKLTIERIPLLFATTSSSMDSSSSSSSYYMKQYGFENGVLKLNDSTSIPFAASYKLFNLKYEYSVTMPGTILKAEYAKNSSGSTATYNIVEMMENKRPIVIESEEMNWLVVGMLVFVVAVLVGLLAYVIFSAVKR